MSSKTSSIYSATKYEIPITCMKKPIHLAIIGDLHRDAPGFSKRAWAHHRRKLRSLDNLYGVLIGDYNDFASTSEKKVTRDVHESTLMKWDHAAIDDTEKVVDELKSCGFLGFLFALNGNHSWEFRTNHLASYGTSALQERGYPPMLPDSDHLLAHMLGTTCPGVMTLCNMVFNYKGCKLSYRWCAHHGKGGGSTVGASLNPIEKMAATAEADIYVQGHTHQMAAAKRVRIQLGPDDITRHKTITLVRNGSFLKAYEDGQPNHVVDALMTPAHLGGAIIRFDLFNDTDAKTGRRSFHAEPMVMF